MKPLNLWAGSFRPNNSNTPKSCPGQRLCDIEMFCGRLYWYRGSGKSCCPGNSCGGGGWFGWLRSPSKPCSSGDVDPCQQQQRRLGRGTCDVICVQESYRLVYTVLVRAWNIVSAVIKADRLLLFSVFITPTAVAVYGIHRCRSVFPHDNSKTDAAGIIKLDRSVPPYVLETHLFRG